MDVVTVARAVQETVQLRAWVAVLRPVEATVQDALAARGLVLAVVQVPVLEVVLGVVRITVRVLAPADALDDRGKKWRSD